MLKVDQVLQGRYHITRVIGHGGMGAVYEARHIELDMVCVVKEMLPSDDEDLVEILAKQFKREAKILAGLRHPSLPRVSDYFTEGGHYYLVMDLINGESLENLIKTQKLPETTVLQIADQLLDVLAYVHTQGVLHRDIKPANIIVQPSGHVVLVDFGLVKVVDGRMSSFSMRGLTPHYAPPEQYTGGSDARSDLYSLAATLYQTLSAQLPTSAADQFAGQPLLSLHQLRPDISTNTTRVIEKTLQLDRSKRCQSAVEMREALKGKTTIDSMMADQNMKRPTTDTKTELLGEQGKRARPHWVLVTVIIIAFIVLSLIVTFVVPGYLQQSSIPTVLPTRIRAWTPVTDLSITPINPTVAITEIDMVVPTVPATSVASRTVQSNDLLLPLAPGVQMEMVRVPAGAFLMGSAVTDTTSMPDERPQSRLTLDDYLIDKYDVTNAQFKAFVNATGYKTTAEKVGTGYTLVVTQWLEVKGADWLHPYGPGSDINGKDNHPVVLVSWDDAVAYCAWTSQVTGHTVVLPNEAQWEKAARGTAGQLYPWGNREPDDSRLNYNMTVKDTTEVGRYSPIGDSPYAVADMAANVWQWTSSVYMPYPYNPNDGREDQSSSDQRVMRGGGFGAVREGVRSARRYARHHDDRFADLGFRVIALPVTK